MILQIRAFFFDAKMDYLPYYKNFSINIDETRDISDVLPMIKEQDFKFAYPQDNLYFKINSLVVDGSEKVSEIVAKFGNELVMEPISQYRAVNGLMINDDDFMQSFQILEPYATKEELTYYKSLYPVHYASSTFGYDNEYIGDSILILAKKMIDDDNKYKEQIIQAISCVPHGLWECEYENGLFAGVEYSSEIESLKSLCDGAPDSKLSSKIGMIGTKRDTKVELDSIDGVSIAIYDCGDSNARESISKQVLQHGGTIVEFDKQDRKAGQELFGTDSHFAALKAGTMLLSAMDAGAGILVTSNSDDAQLFRKHLGLCEKVLKRDIKIDIISKLELSKIAQTRAA